MRVAAFQRAPTVDSAAAVDSVLEDLAWADAEGVDLALFPECHLVGHAYARAAVEARATSRDGALMQALLGRAGGVRATAVVGLFEQRDGRIFNTALVIAQGRVLGGYSKAHPNEEGVEPGRDFPVFEGELRFGVNICNDANHPSTAQRLADGGARVICYPLCNVLRPAVAEQWRSLSLQNLQRRARETGCWVISADAAGRQGDRLSYGCTAVVRPDGEVAARAPELRDHVVVWDLV
jgi:predicted amidohydrolase